MRRIKFRRDKNSLSFFDTKTGAKVRLAIGKYSKASRPELIDMKISDYCVFSCDFCYQNSTPEGAHASLENISYIIDKLKKAKVYEIACLDSDTLVGTPRGLSRIGDLTIGSEVYDSNGCVVKVVNKVVSLKETVKVEGSRGFEVICTPDHLFSVSGKMVPASDLSGLTLDPLFISKEGPNPIIDMAAFITKAKPLRGSKSGKIEENRVRLSHSSDWSPRFVEVDEDVAWLLGLVCAEGFKKGIALHVDEVDIAERAIATYRKISGFGATVYSSSSLNGIIIEFKQPKFFESLFFKALKVGYGAKNKTLGSVFNMPTALVRSALHGLFQGDGAFRTKADKGTTSYSLTLKTVSNVLIADVCYLLKTRFGVDSSVYSGVSPERIIEGRTVPSTSYRMLDVYGRENIDLMYTGSPYAPFADNSDYVLVGKRKYGKNTRSVGTEVTNITPFGVREVVDITLSENSSHLFSISHGVITHNCGGGEPTAHPNFVEILHRTREAGIVPNFTTKDLKKTIEMWPQIASVVGAVAYSTNSWRVLENVSRRLSDAGIDMSRVNLHYVMGLDGPEGFIKYMTEAKRLGFRVTLLGYKTTGRGGNVVPKDYDSWFIPIVSLLLSSNRLPTLAIDTPLAEQFSGRMPVDTRFYHTREGYVSAYIDAVSMTFGASSFESSETLVPFDETWLDHYAAL